jgi:GTP-binding protein
MITVLPGIQRPCIALVGRPNVGKSTLFNRLIGVRKAVVSSTRGTTRDRLYGHTEWRGVPLTLIDTGGFEFAAGNGLAEAVQHHIWRALQEADGFVLVCDAKEGLVPADEMIMERLRKTGKPVVLALNKIDHRLVVPPEFFSLGGAAAFPLSALHGRGTGDLLDHLVTHLTVPQRHPSEPSQRTDLPAAPNPAQAPGDFDGGQADVPSRHPTSAVAIVGRQNVGKSSLLNSLLREERVIVSEVPGTTRDAVDTHLTVHGEPLVLIDTAGLRRRRKVKDPVDLFSMSRALEAIERCNVALVVLDATQGVTRDDQRITAQVCQAGRGLVILVNKWDRVRGGSDRTLTEAIRRALPFASFAPVLAVSAKTGFQIPRSLTTTLRVIRAMQQELSEAACLALLQKAWGAHPPPRFRGRTIRLQQARWLPGRPVRVELTTSPIGRLPLPYQHYLLKYLHASPRLTGVPIRLVVKTPNDTKGALG